MFRDFGMDHTGLNEIFYQAFDSLLMLNFGDYSKIIYFYLYERKNPDGTINSLKDEEGNVIKLDNCNDLWELIKRLKPLSD